MELVKRLPYIIELNTGQETIVIAHADYPDNEYQFGKEVPLFNVVWARERISDSMDDIGGEISGADRFYLWSHSGEKPEDILESAVYRHWCRILRKPDIDESER